jgi:hypothetical protein
VLIVSRTPAVGDGCDEDGVLLGGSDAVLMATTEGDSCDDGSLLSGTDCAPSEVLVSAAGDSCLLRSTDGDTCEFMASAVGDGSCGDDEQRLGGREEMVDGWHGGDKVSVTDPEGDAQASLCFVYVVCVCVCVYIYIYIHAERNTLTRFPHAFFI